MPLSVEQYFYFILIPCGFISTIRDTWILHSMVEIYLSLCFRCAFKYCVVWLYCCQLRHGNPPPGPPVKHVEIGVWHLCCWNTLNVSNLHEMSSNRSLYIPLREPELPVEGDAICFWARLLDAFLPYSGRFGAWRIIQKVLKLLISCIRLGLGRGPWPFGRRVSFATNEDIRPLWMELTNLPTMHETEVGPHIWFECDHCICQNVGLGFTTFRVLLCFI